MKKTDVIIIGAGAAGLMAAYTLVKAGKSVTVLEARNRLGGRIHTLPEGSFSSPVELGAEFVHGNLPVTLSLLKEAGIGTSDVGFEMWQQHNGTFKQSEEFIEGWDDLLEKLNQLEDDMTLHDFLEKNYAGKEHSKKRNQIESYVAGYDTADALDASAFALRREWNNENEDSQHRVNRGYTAMIQYLADACLEAGSDILLNAAAAKIIRTPNKIEVITIGGTGYEAAKVIVALPLGVLQAHQGDKGVIVFAPPMPVHTEALNNIGFGSIIKILLEFDEVFWKSDEITKRTGADLSTMGFLFTDEVIPTYWTQSPAHSTLLTGWLGGPAAYAVKNLSDKEIMQMAIDSLSNVFKIAAEALTAKVVAWEVANWTAEPYTLGSYAYDKVKSPAARKLLLQPVENVLYFAGEYLYDGPAMGTVEAALTSGKNVAERILKG